MIAATIKWVCHVPLPVQVCTVWRGSIGERSGIRVGHKVIEINGTSTVGMEHDDIVHLLSTTVGDVSLFCVFIVSISVIL